MSKPLFVCLFALATASAPVAAAPPDAATILRRADRAVLGEAAAYTLRMTVVRPGKPERVVEMKGWKKGDEQGLVRYTAPAKERGTAYLRSGESTWLFLPSAEKVVRVGAKQNFGGGDFSNADIFRLSLVRDYDPTLAGEETAEGEACYKLELKAKDRSIAYDRVVYWVRSDGTFYPVKADYYTLSGKNLKSLVLSQVKPVGGRPRPTLMTMQSRVDEGSRTLLEFLTIQDDPKLDDRLFSPSALERGEQPVLPSPRGTGTEGSAVSARAPADPSPAGWEPGRGSFGSTRMAILGMTRLLRSSSSRSPSLPPRPARSRSASRASATAAPRRRSTATTSSASTTTPGLVRLALGWRETHGSSGPSSAATSSRTGGRPATGPTG